MVIIMAHPVRMQVTVFKGVSAWLDFECEGGSVQVCLSNLPPKIREGLIALAKEQTA